MKPLKIIKPVFLLDVLVLISGAAGGLLGHRLARVQIENRNDPENWNKRVSLEFVRLVKPSPDQTVRIQVYFDKAVRELQDIRLDTIKRSTNVIWTLVGNVEKELTPDQLKAFEAIKPRPEDLTLDVLKVDPQ